MATYQVVAECAHVTVDTAFGRSVTLLLKGALVPADAPQLQHLLEIGSVAKVGGDETGGVDASGIPAGAYDAEVPGGLTTTPVEKSEAELKADREAAEKSKVDEELAEKRAAAKAKLPSDGSAPDGRASKDVLAEYLAGKGYSYDELVKQDKADLVDLTK